MMEKIKELAKGNLRYELPEIVLSQKTIEVVLEAGKAAVGELAVSNSEKTYMKGVVYSDSRLFRVENTQFAGENSIIRYELCSGDLSPGQEAKGFLTLACDCGEQRIPYRIQVDIPGCITSMGKIQNLYHFANLAKRDWIEAVKLFKSEDFERVILNHDRKNQMIYRSLIRSLSTSHALEEFLIAARKKLKIRFEADRTKIVSSAEGEAAEERITITKDGWGYAEIKVTSDVPFLIPERRLIWADNFIGNQFVLEVELVPEKARGQNSTGRVFLKSAYQTIVIEITIERKAAKQNAARLQEKKGISQLLSHYLSFRMNRMEVSRYVEETSAVLRNLFPLTAEKEDGEETMRFTLLQTYLYIVEGRKEQAGELFHVLESKGLEEKEQIVEYCGILYLKALFTKKEEDIGEACAKIREFYEQGYRDWKLLWYLLYMDKSYEKNAAGKLADIREHLIEGCRSPILYLEAALLYNEEPRLLREMDGETALAVHWAVGEDFLSEEAAARYAYLAGRKKQFHLLVHKNLCALYKKYGGRDTLTALVSHLIKGQKSGREYFPWYALGVREQIRVTELYEYYMYSAGADSMEELPASLLHYFAFDSSLSDRKKEYLYARVIEKKKENPVIYEAYQKAMERFACAKLKEGRVNGNLALLYQDILKKEMLNEETAAMLPEVMFQYEFYCGNPDMVQVCVVHKEWKGEICVPLEEKRAQITIFTENAGLFLVDKKGNRYGDTVDYTLLRLLNMDDYVDVCFSNHCTDERLLLYMLEQIESYHKSGQHMMYIKERLSASEHVQDCYKIKWSVDLINYYQAGFEEGLPGDLLRRIDLELLPRAERSRMIEYMIMRNLYGEAEEAVKRHGCDGIAVKWLMRLWTRLAAGKDAPERQENLVTMGIYIFNSGKYNELLLRYLVRFYDGPTKEMLRLWKAAEGFELEDGELMERLLAQMLFSETGGVQTFPVFYSYYRKGNNRKLIRAFLNYYSYRYLLNDWNAEPEFFKIVDRELHFEENETGMLALLKYYSQKETLNEEEERLSAYYMDKMIEKEIVLPFFKDFQNKIPVPFSIRNKQYVEYRANPSHKVTLHYLLENEEEQENFIMASMKNVFGGIFVKAFTLFRDETLQYYISEEGKDGETITKSTAIAFVNRIEDADSKFGMINLMLTAQEMQDEETLLDCMEQFIKMEYAVENLFKPL